MRTPATVWAGRLNRGAEMQLQLRAEDLGGLTHQRGLRQARDGVARIDHRDGDPEPGHGLRDLDADRAGTQDRERIR